MKTNNRGEWSLEGRRVKYPVRKDPKHLQEDPWVNIIRGINVCPWVRVPKIRYHDNKRNVIRLDTGKSLERYIWVKNKWLLIYMYVSMKIHVFEWILGCCYWRILKDFLQVFFYYMLLYWALAFPLFSKKNFSNPVKGL